MLNNQKSLYDRKFHNTYAAIAQVLGAARNDPSASIDDKIYSIKQAQAALADLLRVFLYYKNTNSNPPLPPTPPPKGIA